MKLNRRPTLTGPTVRIRPLVEADREALYAVAQDPGIWEQHPSERRRRAEFDSYFDEALASGGAVAPELCSTAGEADAASSVCGVESGPVQLSGHGYARPW